MVGWNTSNDMWDWIQLCSHTFWIWDFLKHSSFTSVPSKSRQAPGLWAERKTENNTDWLSAQKPTHRHPEISQKKKKRDNSWITTKLTNQKTDIGSFCTLKKICHRVGYEHHGRLELHCSLHVILNCLRKIQSYITWPLFCEFINVDQCLGVYSFIHPMHVTLK